MTDLPTVEPGPGEVPDAAAGTTRTASPPPSKPPRGGLLRHHDFRQLFLGDMVSQVGTQLTVLALPVLAIRVLGAEELEMGLLGTFEFLAFLVIGLPAGAWVDRWRKKRVLVNADIVRALALGSLPLAWALDVLTLPQMFAVALVVGVSTVFFDVAYQSYLPELVPSEKISEGNAKLQAVQSVAQVGGPATAGFLIRAVGAPLTIALDALSFLASALFVSRIRHVDQPPPRADRRPLVEEVKEGLVFVVHQPLLLRIAACTSIGNLFNSMSTVLLVLFALRELGLSVSDLGIVFALGSAGGLLGALVTTRISRKVGEGRTIALAALLFAPFAALVPLAGEILPPMLALSLSMFGYSFAVLVYNITQVSFRQRLCPRPLLGRMNASIRFVVWGTMPIGSFVGGFLGSQLGIRPVYWIAVAGAVVAAFPVLFSPLVTMRDLPRELDQHAEQAA